MNTTQINRIAQISEEFMQYAHGYDVVQDIATKHVMGLGDNVRPSVCCLQRNANERIDIYSQYNNRFVNQV